jgi:hypothetical protein
MIEPPEKGAIAPLTDSSIVEHAGNVALLPVLNYVLARLSLLCRSTSEGAAGLDLNTRV